MQSKGLIQESKLQDAVKELETQLNGLNAVKNQTAEQKQAADEKKKELLQAQLKLKEQEDFITNKNKEAENAKLATAKLLEEQKAKTLLIINQLIEKAKSATDEKGAIEYQIAQLQQEQKNIEENLNNINNNLKSKEELEEIAKKADLAKQDLQEKQNEMVEQQKMLDELVTQFKLKLEEKPQPEQKKPQPEQKKPQPEQKKEQPKITLDLIVNNYNESIKNSPKQADRYNTFKNKIEDLGFKDEKMIKQGFNAMYSKYNGKEIQDNCKELQDDVTWREFFKAFFYAIITLGFGTSTRYNKNTFQDFIKKANTFENQDLTGGIQ